MLLGWSPRAALIAVLCVSACIPFRHGPVRTHGFAISATADANDNAPTAVDAVMIHDPAVLAAVSKLTAAQWFATREQVQNDFPDGLEVQEWEVVPGAQVSVSRLPFKRKGLALFVFANYRGQGDHRARLDTWGDPRVVLQQRTFTVIGR